MRPDDLVVPAGEIREWTRAEIEEALHADPEVTLMTEYLLGELGGDASAEVERRLREDAAFRARMAPVMEAWNRWPGPRDFSMPADEVAASWDRLERKATAAGLLPALEHQAGRPAGERHGEAEAPSAVRRTRRWQLAAGMLLAIGLPGAVWFGATLWPRLTAPKVTVTSARPADGTTVMLDDHSVALVWPSGRLTWPDRANARGVRELQLDGDAMFRLAPLKAGAYVIVTPSARIVVTGTVFTVTMPNPSTTRVSVEAGSVVLESRGGVGGAPVTLTVGETGEAVWGEAPRRGR